MAVEVHAEWDFGTEFAKELLETINLLSKSPGGRGMKKIETEDFTVYWAGAVLRVDIPEHSVR